MSGMAWSDSAPAALDEYGLARQHRRDPDFARQDLVDRTGVGDLQQAFGLPVAESPRRAIRLISVPSAGLPSGLKLRRRAAAIACALRTCAG